MTTTPQPRVTKRQAEIYEFLKAGTRPASPTVREICAHFGFKSPNGAVCHLVALERKGLIRRHPGKARSVEVLA